VIATETWLNNTIADSELESDSYTIYRKDRTTGSGGGVLVAINSSITSTSVSIKTKAEILLVKVNCLRHRDIYIAACYRPNIADKTFTENLRESLTRLSKKKRPNAYTIAGDFNLPGFD
jgi:hypothetical protein